MQERKQYDESRCLHPLAATLVPTTQPLTTLFIYGFTPSPTHPTGAFLKQISGMRSFYSKIF